MNYSSRQQRERDSTRVDKRRTTDDGRRTTDDGRRTDKPRRVGDVCIGWARRSPQPTKLYERKDRNQEYKVDSTGDTQPPSYIDSSRNAILALPTRSRARMRSVSIPTPIPVPVPACARCRCRCRTPRPDARHSRRTALLVPRTLLVTRALLIAPTRLIRPAPRVIRIRAMPARAVARGHGDVRRGSRRALVRIRR